MIDTVHIARWWRACAAAVTLAFAGLPPAEAQVQTAIPPVFSSVDRNNFDNVSARYRLNSTEVVIGQPGSGGLVHSRTWFGTSWRDDLAGTVNLNSGIYTVSLFGRSETFTLSGGVYTSQQQIGSTLSYNAGTGIWTYLMADGTVAEFYAGLASNSSQTNFWASNYGTILHVTRPDGEIITWYYDVTAPIDSKVGIRPQTISNNFGYQLHFSYALDTPTTAADLSAGFVTRTKVTGVNRGFSYCADVATTCADSAGAIHWPYVTYGTESSGAIQTVTNRVGDVMRYVVSGDDLTGIRTPTSPSSNVVTISYSGGHVQEVTTATSDATYIVDDSSGSDRVITMYNAAGETGRVTSSLATGFVSQICGDNSCLQTTTYLPDAYGRISKVTLTDGSHTDYVYDSRGNVTLTTQYTKTSAAFATLTSSAHFPSCVYGGVSDNSKKCNKPDYTIDTRGFKTSFEYDASHGGMTKVTSPQLFGDPPNGDHGDTPETRFTYQSLSAWYMAAGTLAPGPAIYRQIGTSSCAKGLAPACLGTPDETRAVVTYQSGSSVTPSNLLPATTTARSGNTSGPDAVSASASMTYTPQGDVATVDGPLSGSADTSNFYYDDVRRLVAEVSADPDAGGGLDHREKRTTYTNGNPTLVELGYVSDPANWSSAMTVLQQQAQSFEPNTGLLSQVRMKGWYSGSSGFVDVYLKQFEYNFRGELHCAALRMNPYAFDALQAQRNSDSNIVCNQGSNIGYGPDRITMDYHDAYDQLAQNASGLGSSLPRQDVTRWFTNGQMTSQLDASNYRTEYKYDGFGRIEKISYPSPSSQYAVSTTDYEQFFYDATGRLEHTLDRGETSMTSYAYDNSGNLTTLDDVGTANDVNYFYDNFGRVTRVELASTPTIFVEYRYDALGRVLSENQSGRTVSYEYDVAGRRTRMTWPGGTYFVCYDYDALGELIAMRENCATSGAGVLEQIAYDNLGRLTWLVRGTGSYEARGYDWGSRLWGYGRDLSGSAYDLWTAFNINPAGQWVNKSTSTDAYKFGLGPAYTHDYTSNGLNELTSKSSVGTFTYNNHGDLETGAGATFLYDKLNHLTSVAVTGGATIATLGYDPLGRLFQYSASGHAAVQYLYDGANIIAELDASSGSVLRRYVHGPETDQPLVEVDNATGVRTDLFADEHGSIVARETGSSVSINRYDEYGVPAATNQGLFQYTGQIYLPEIGLYHYKARTYSPSLGRFLQPDPVGYEAGTNLYAYVGDDPMNARDPSGLERDPDCDRPSFVSCGTRQKTICDDDFLSWFSQACSGRDPCSDSDSSAVQRIFGCAGPVREAARDIYEGAVDAIAAITFYRQVGLAGEECVARALEKQGFEVWGNGDARPTYFAAGFSWPRFLDLAVRGGPPPYQYKDWTLVETKTNTAKDRYLGSQQESKDRALFSRGGIALNDPDIPRLFLVPPGRRQTVVASATCVALKCTCNDPLAHPPVR